MKNQPLDTKTLRRLQLEERRSELILAIDANQAVLKVLRRNKWLMRLLPRYEAEGIRLEAEYDGLSYQLFRSNPMINPHVALSEPTLLRLIKSKIQRRYVANDTQ